MSSLTTISKEYKIYLDKGIEGEEKTGVQIWERSGEGTWALKGAFTFPHPQTQTKKV